MDVEDAHHQPQVSALYIQAEGHSAVVLCQHSLKARGELSTAVSLMRASGHLVVKLRNQEVLKYFFSPCSVPFVLCFLCPRACSIVLVAQLSCTFFAECSSSSGLKIELSMRQLRVCVTAGEMLRA